MGADNNRAQRAGRELKPEPGPTKEAFVTTDHQFPGLQTYHYSPISAQRGPVKAAEPFTSSRARRAFRSHALRSRMSFRDS